MHARRLIIPGTVAVGLAGLLLVLARPATPEPTPAPEATPARSPPPASVPTRVATPVRAAEPVPAPMGPEERLQQLRAFVDARRPARPADAPPDDDVRLEERYAQDAVGSLFPALGEEPPARQLETLRWMRGLPPSRVVAAMPRLLKAFPRDAQLREGIAREMLELLIELRENEGHEAPEMPDGFTVAAIAEAPPVAEPMEEEMQASGGVSSARP